MAKYMGMGCMVIVGDEMVTGVKRRKGVPLPYQN